MSGFHSFFEHVVAIVHISLVGSAHSQLMEKSTISLIALHVFDSSGELKCLSAPQVVAFAPPSKVLVFAGTSVYAFEAQLSSLQLSVTSLQDLRELGTKSIRRR